MSQEEVLEATQTSQVTAWRWVKLGILPEPVRIGRGYGKGTMNRWPKEAIARAKFARKMIAEKTWTLAEIAQMVQERWP